MTEKYDYSVPLDEMPMRHMIHSYDVKSWLEDNYDTIVHALKLAENVPQWMPIETAPRDGTKCLFLTAEPEQGSPAYNMKEGRIFSGKWSDHDFILEGAYTRKPTHWMPLPRGPHD